MSKLEPIINNEILTTKEAAEYLRVSEYTLRELCRKKQIPHFRIGNHLIRFDRHELIEWKNKQLRRSVR